MKQLENYRYNPVKCIHVIQYEELVKYGVTGIKPKNKHWGFIKLSEIK